VVCVEGKKSNGGGGNSCITSYGFKGLVKWHPPALMYRSGEFNSSAKGIKPPVTHMVREHVQTMTQLRPAVYCASLEAHGDLSKVYRIYILTTESVRRRGE
jgi:hypothetical protein